MASTFMDRLTALFLQFVSTSSTGGTVTNYSSRFGMKGMTGKFPAQVEKGMKTVGTKAKQGPPTENDAASKESVGANGPYAMPFSMQTGLTKYAPMQPQPPTKISMKTVSPQYPPSNVPIAQKNMAPPSQVTTVTQTQTYSVSSMENTASPLSMPQDPMQKFLNRWKD
ncbi:MAG: hypothetical protein M1828_004724 [Chrysothrix sp. TS-e1954]|nr:MAG: hypothetical protein M1828_004724 [Chrysothrix sp. TS-e1954]